MKSEDFYGAAGPVSFLRVGRIWTIEIGRLRIARTGTGILLQWLAVG